MLDQRESVETVAIVPLTGDRGLAGAFNAQIVRRALALERSLQAEGKGVRWVPSARRAARRSSFVAASSPGVHGLHRQAGVRGRAGHRPSLRRAVHRGEVDRVTLVYNTYISALTQRVTEQDILPISPDILETDEEERAADALRGDFIFEPEPEEIMLRLLPVYLETQMYPHSSSRPPRSRAHA